MLFPQLPSTSKVWVYQSQTKIPQEIQRELKSELDVFVEGWAAHGDELFGAAEILEDYFIVLAVDESKVMASGCSIDTSVRFIRELSKDFKLDLLNRLNVLIIEDGEQKIVHYSDIVNHRESIVYNPLVQSLGELRNSWKVKISESQFV